MRWLLLFVFLCAALNCSEDKAPSGPPGDADFAVYFLKDTSMTTQEAMEHGLEDVELENEPWLSSEDIDFYDFSTHCIYLKTDKGDFFENFREHSFYFTPPLTDRPFVVAGGGERCYMGSLHSAALSMAPRGPFVDESDVGYYPTDVIHISRVPMVEQDLRDSECVEKALADLDLLRDGPSVMLDAVRIVENADTSTVQYTFTITNHDRDDLYVPDPDVMGNGLFHFYTNGVVFVNETTHLESKYKIVVAPDPYYYWETSWFARLETDETLQRTVTLKGYPRIPSGTYSCTFVYSGPVKIEREERLLADGRIWIGEIVSGAIEVIVAE